MPKLSVWEFLKEKEKLLDVVSPSYFKTKKGVKSLFLTPGLFRADTNRWTREYRKYLKLHKPQQYERMRKRDNLRSARNYRNLTPERRAKRMENNRKSRAKRMENLEQREKQRAANRRYSLRERMKKHNLFLTIFIYVRSPTNSI